MLLRFHTAQRKRNYKHIQARETFWSRVVLSFASARRIASKPFSGWNMFRDVCACSAAGASLVKTGLYTYCKLWLIEGSWKNIYRYFIFYILDTSVLVLTALRKLRNSFSEVLWDDWFTSLLPYTWNLQQKSNKNKVCGCIKAAIFPNYCNTEDKWCLIDWHDYSGRMRSRL